MAITETIFVKEADSKSGVGKNDKPYTLWTVVDGTDRKFKTFDAQVGEPSKTYAGSYAEVDYEEKRNGAYTDFQLKAIRPAREDQVSTPFPPRDPQDFIHKSSDRDRELDRLDCLKAAFAHTAIQFAKIDESDRPALEAYSFGLASRMEKWFRGDTITIQPDDIPFA